METVDLFTFIIEKVLIWKTFLRLKKSQYTGSFRDIKTFLIF